MNAVPTLVCVNPGGLNVDQTTNPSGSVIVNANEPLCPDTANVPDAAVPVTDHPILVLPVAAIVVVNNILHKYWKPVRMFTADSWHINPPHRFAEPHEVEQEKIPPVLDKVK